MVVDRVCQWCHHQMEPGLYVEKGFDAQGRPVVIDVCDRCKMKDELPRAVAKAVLALGMALGLAYGVHAFIKPPLDLKTLLFLPVAVIVPLASGHLLMLMLSPWVGYRFRLRGGAAARGALFVVATLLAAFLVYRLVG